MSGQGSGEIAPHRYLWEHRAIQQAFAECPQDMSCCRVGNGEHVPSPDASPDGQGKEAAGWNTWAFLTTLLPWIHLVKCPRSFRHPRWVCGHPLWYVSSCRIAKTPPVNEHLQVLQGVSGRGGAAPCYFQALGRGVRVRRKSAEFQLRMTLYGLRAWEAVTAHHSTVLPWLGTRLRNTRLPAVSPYFSVSPSLSPKSLRNYPFDNLFVPYGSVCMCVHFLIL